LHEFSELLIGGADFFDPGKDLNKSAITLHNEVWVEKSMSKPM